MSCKLPGSGWCICAAQGHMKLIIKSTFIEDMSTFYNMHVIVE